MPIDHTTDSVTLPFSATGCGPVALSWAQRAFWHSIALAAPHDEHLTMPLVIPVPDRTGMPRVLRCLTDVVESHESLRTRYLLDASGTPVQEVPAEGELTITVLDVRRGTPAAAAEELRRRLCRRRYDLLTEWPVRIGVVVHRDAPCFIVMALSHMVADRWGVGVLYTDLARSLHRTANSVSPSAETAWQPRDQVRYEQSAVVLRQEERALEHFGKQLQKFPAALFASPPYEPERPRYQCGTLTSPALGAAVSLLARQQNVSPASALLAALSCVLSYKTRRTSSSLFVHFANRFHRNARSVGCYTQSTPVHIDLSDLSFHETVQAAHAAAWNAYRFARYSPEGRGEVIERVSRERGIALAEDCLFNSPRGASGDPWRSSPKPSAADSLDELAKSTTFVREEGIHTGMALYAEARPPHGLQLIADTGFLRPADIEQCLRATESLLITAARHDFPAADLLASTGMARLHSQEYLRYVDNCWVDLRAVRELVLHALDTDDAEVTAAPRPDGDVGLTARVRTRAPALPPADARALCLRALPRWEAAMVPHEFVWG